MKDCIFCKIIRGEIPSSKVFESEKVLAFLDINPVSKGHTLVIPKTHHVGFSEIPADLLTERWGKFSRGSDKPQRRNSEAMASMFS